MAASSEFGNHSNDPIILPLMNIYKKGRENSNKATSTAISVILIIFPLFIVHTPLLNVDNIYAIRIIPYSFAKYIMNFAPIVCDDTEAC